MSVVNMLIKFILKLLPFVLLVTVMWYVSYFGLEMIPMIIAAILGTIGFMGLAILSDSYESLLLRKVGPKDRTVRTGIMGDDEE